MDLLLFGNDALRCHSCDCTPGSWGNIISSLLRWKFVLRSPREAQIPNGWLHQVILGLPRNKTKWIMFKTLNVSALETYHGEKIRLSAIECDNTCSMLVR